jgi:hypothetical protein
MRREEGYCTPCRHLYVLRDPAPPAIREERERMVAAHDRWKWITRRLVSLILPGAGQVQGGRTFLGILLLGGAATAAAALLLSGHLLAYVQVAAGAGAGSIRVAAAAAIAACWLAGNVLSFERKA